MTALIAACILAAILGFAAHRASVCTVRGVAEVLSSRQGYMLASIGKSVLWVSVVTLPFLLLVPSAGENLGGWQLSGAAVLGGFVFGIGAGINGACAYSTMARLANGEVGMGLTVLAFGFGVLGFVTLAQNQWLARPSPTPALVAFLIQWAMAPALLLIAALLAWGLYEGVRLWRTRPTDIRVTQLPLAGQYRLSSAAMVVGVASAAIVLLYGSSGYSTTLQQVVEGLVGTRRFPVAERWMVLAAVLAGMILSTLQRGTFRIDARPRRTWLRNIGGGLLMGFGVALAPGGNDALVLYGIPALSPHALPAFLAMAIGIAAALLLLRVCFGIETRVICRSDVFISDAGLGDPKHAPSRTQLR